MSNTFWEKKEKKTIFTLAVDDYAPEITEITFPLMKAFAQKIGADFYVIKDRKFPDMPPVYEKLQIYDLGREMNNDWNWFMDADTLVHPEMLDATLFLKKDTVCHNGNDQAYIRWRYDRYFKRDGRNIGSCNWFTIGSDWCIDIWKALDISFAEAVDNITPTVNELNTVIIPEHLIDDYTLSRNIAKYGLKFTTFTEVQRGLGFAPEKTSFLWHIYTHTIDEKINGWTELNAKGETIRLMGMKDVLKVWKVM